MPNSIVSHQVPGLLLKMKYPKRIDGISVYLSAFVPDLNVILEPFMPFTFRHVTHSLLGLFIWVVPITILLTILVSRYIGPRVSKMVRKKRKLYTVALYFGIDELYHLKKKKFDRRFYFISFYSALIGGITHLLLDLPAHRHVELFFPWAYFLNPDVLLVPVFELNRTIPLYEIIWSVEDAILLGISLFLLRKIKKDSLIEKWYENKNLIKVQT